MMNRLAGAADHDITRLLGRAAEGDDTAFEQVAAWAYAELERLAARRMRRRYRGRLDGLTLEPAALVNETFLRLLETRPGSPTAATSSPSPAG
jgi:DNA-directed RNA polymerase specialized sigma24 family protein